jgi:hypothetical protein
MMKISYERNWQQNNDVSKGTGDKVYSAVVSPIINVA